MTFYRRRLPHWHPQGVPIFLTWRLHGSLPRALALTEVRTASSAGQRFVALERRMDQAETGPVWLKDSRVARCVAETLFRGETEWGLYTLSAWVVMPNHVHVLVDPRKPVPELTRAVKSSSARLANQILERSGVPFWQDESYDHWVRDRDEFNRIVKYIESNPVRAGLVQAIHHWPWSSASWGRPPACPPPSASCYAT